MKNFRKWDLAKTPPLLRCAAVSVLSFALLLAFAGVGVAAPEEVLVLFSSAPPGGLSARQSARSLEQALEAQRVPGQVREIFPYLNGVRMTLDSASRGRLAGHPDVAVVVSSHLGFETASRPRRHPLREVPWHVQWARNARVAEGLTPDAWKPVCVVLLDTGLFPHPDFAAASVHWELALDAFSGTRGKEAVRDLFGHGTAVAGVLGGAATGIVPEVGLLPVRSASDQGRMEVAQIAAAVDYVLALAAPGNPLEGKKLLFNFSYTSAPSDGPQEDYAAFLRAILERLAASDALFVAAAGNHHCDADEFHVYPACLAALNLVSCAATNDAGTLEAFSNFGRLSVEVGAPGNAMVTTASFGRGYVTGDGTSFSTPVVTGIAAALWARFPDLTAWQVRNVLLNATDAPLWMRAVGPFVPTETLAVLAGGALRPERAGDPAFVDAAKGHQPAALSPSPATGGSSGGGSGGCAMGSPGPLFALSLFLPLAINVGRPRR